MVVIFSVIRNREVGGRGFLGVVVFFGLYCFWDVDGS